MLEKPRDSVLTRPWLASSELVAAGLDTDGRAGLTAAEAQARLNRFGGNELATSDRITPWLLFTRQFANSMIVVLMIAAVITGLLGDLTDTAVIIAIVIVNAVIGFVQEYRADRALAALSAMTEPRVRVVRDGAAAEIPAAEIVPGDLVLLAPGDVVAADVRLTEAKGLRISEAALTGESEPVSKTDDPILGAGTAAAAAIPVSERWNMAFRGTAVTAGRGAGLVVASGMSTELGRIAGLLEADHRESTPLQRRLAVLGRWLGLAALVVCAVVFVAGVLRGEPVDLMLLTAVSLAVAAIPEGLPVVVAVSLALGAQRMARRRALTRRLPAVETLGSVTVICTDKTGTLTENRMLVQRVWTPFGEYRVAGSGYAPVGSVQPVSARLDATGSERDEALRRLAAVGAACNDASLRPPPPHDRAEHAWTATGDPTEASLLALAGKLGVEREALVRDRPRLAEIGFDANRRRMTTVHRHGLGYWVATKGAPEAVLPLVHPTDAGIAYQAAAMAATWAAAGYRVLALADRELPSAPDVSADPDAIESGLRLVGVVAMSDPARAEAAAAVAACRSAGITPVMITGDDPRTARAIAGQVGILPEPSPGGPDGAAVITGADLTRLDDPTLRRRVSSVLVYARTEPEQKLRIVDALQSRGDIVAMTGDGVNDAPALRRADIGVAMGISGTEVSKDAADMVLADDNFATIVDAVREGRRIYDNLRRFVKYLLTTNSGEIWVMFLASVFAFPVPLSPVQILWVNLVTDGAPAVALGLEPAERDVMRRSPRPPSEPIMAGGLSLHALWVGLLMAAVCLVMLVAARDAGWPWQTMVFTTLALLQLGHALAVRSERESFFALGPWSNPTLLASVVVGFAAQLAIVYLAPLRELFGTEPLDSVQLAVVLLASCTAFFAVEVEKLLRRRAAGRVQVS